LPVPCRPVALAIDLERERFGQPGQSSNHTAARRIEIKIDAEAVLFRLRIELNDKTVTFGAALAGDHAAGCIDLCASIGDVHFAVDRADAAFARDRCLGDEARDLHAANIDVEIGQQRRVAGRGFAEHRNATQNHALRRR